MKSTICEPKNEETERFPRLMRSKYSGAIYLITNIRETSFSGTVVHGKSGIGKGIGYTSDGFCPPHALEDFNGTITLKN